jgi:hypothetical protein
MCATQPPVKALRMAIWEPKYRVKMDTDFKLRTLNNEYGVTLGQLLDVVAEMPIGGRKMGGRKSGEEKH